MLFEVHKFRDLPKSSTFIIIYLYTCGAPVKNHQQICMWCSRQDLDPDLLFMGSTVSGFGRKWFPKKAFAFNSHPDGTWTLGSITSTFSYFFHRIKSSTKTLVQFWKMFLKWLIHHTSTICTRPSTWAFYTMSSLLNMMFLLTSGPQKHSSHQSLSSFVESAQWQLLVWRMAWENEAPRCPVVARQKG